MNWRRRDSGRDPLRDDRAEGSTSIKPKRTLSAAARKRIGDAQRKRWAATKNAVKTAPVKAAKKAAAPTKKRRMSAATRTAAFNTINAKAETVATSPAYREPWKRRRCLVPADWFYEWKKIDEKTKQPYAISLKDGGLFAFAGLWDTWKDKV